MVNYITLEEPICIIEKHKDINIDFIIKNLFISKMEGEEFLSLLQVCKNTIVILLQMYLNSNYNYYNYFSSHYHKTQNHLYKNL